MSEEIRVLITKAKTPEKLPKLLKTASEAALIEAGFANAGVTAWGTYKRLTLQELARRKLLTADSTAPLLTSDDASVRGAVAAATRDKGTQKSLASDSSPLVRTALASNPYLSPQTAGTLCQDDDWAVARALAAHHPRKAPVTAALLCHPSRAVRRLLAQSAPLASVTPLWEDEDVYVRKALAERKDAPVEMLERFAGDSSSVVRRAVAKSRGAGDELLRSLATDSSPYVRDGVAKSRYASEELKSLAGDATR